jgi:hypothetical protein
LPLPRRQVDSSTSFNTQICLSISQVYLGLIGCSPNEGQVSFWRTSDGGIRWLLVLGLMYVISMIADVHRYGVNSLRWLESLGFAVASLAAVPLEEPARREWTYRLKLRTWYGRLSFAFLVVALGLLLWRASFDLFSSQ